MKNTTMLDTLKTHERRAAFGRGLYRAVRIPDGVGKDNLLAKIGGR